MTRQFPTRTRRFLTLALIALPLLIISTAIAQPPDTLWTKTWDYGSDYEYMEAVRALPDGGYIATGSVDYYGENIQYWTARLDQSGDEIWLHIEGSPSTDGAHYIEPTSDGGFIQCGEVWGNGFDPYIRKLDADGNEEWRTVIPGWIIGELFYCVREVPAGGYIAVGYSANGTAFRFDEDGNFMWQWTDEDSMYKPQWIEPLADGGFVTCSDHWNADIEQRVPVFYKLDANGDVEWTNDEMRPGEPVEGRSRAIREAADGYLYSCGSLRNLETYYDFYLSKRNPDGSVIWAVTFANPNGTTDGFDEAIELCFAADDNIIVGGYSEDGEHHVHNWLLKISTEGELLWMSDVFGGDISSIDLGRDGSMIASWYPRENLGQNSQNLALMKWEPEIEVLLDPYVQIVPPQGRRMHYRAYVSNILLDPTPLDVWATVITPAGNTYPLQQIAVTMQPGGTFYRPNVPLDIPAAAPPGEYTFELHVGVAPPTVPPGGPNGSRNMGLGSFTFTKLQP